MTTKFKRNLMIALAVASLWIAQLACDENPCSDGSACGMTSPVSEVEQVIINAVDTDCTDNVLSGC